MSDNELYQASFRSSAQRQIRCRVCVATRVRSAAERGHRGFFCSNLNAPDAQGSDIGPSLSDLNSLSSS